MKLKRTLTKIPEIVYLFNKVVNLVHYPQIFNLYFNQKIILDIIYSNEV